MAEFGTGWWGLLASAWGESLLRATVQGGCAILAVYLWCRLVPGTPASVRCWLWRAAFLRLLLALVSPGMLDLPLLPPPAHPPVTAQTEPPTVEVALPAPVAQPTTTATIEAGAPAPERTSLFSSPAEPLLLLWLLGTGMCLLRLAGHARSLDRFRRNCLPEADADRQAAYRFLCRQAGIPRPPLLVRMPGLRSPLLTGLLRPVVVLPEPCEASPVELRMMLAHELGHFRRADLLWSWLPAIAHLLFYFHPLVWLASREWRVAQESACDELALQLTGLRPAQYGELLVRLAGALPPPVPQPSGAGVLWAFTDSPFILQRRLIAMKQRAQLRPYRAFASAGAAMAVGTAVLIPMRVTAQVRRETADPAAPKAVAGTPDSPNAGDPNAQRALDAARSRLEAERRQVDRQRHDLDERRRKLDDELHQLRQGKVPEASEAERLRQHTRELERQLTEARDHLAAATRELESARRQLRLRGAIPGREGGADMVPADPTTPRDPNGMPGEPSLRDLKRYPREGKDSEKLRDELLQKEAADALRARSEDLSRLRDAKLRALQATIDREMKRYRAEIEQQVRARLRDELRRDELRRYPSSPMQPGSDDARTVKPGSPDRTPDKQDGSKKPLQPGEKPGDKPGERKVPILGDIPILGNLFRITPRSEAKPQPEQKTAPKPEGTPEKE
jgi:beta-lactamase regulating signal transducer with metallopeptidase domain